MAGWKPEEGKETGDEGLKIKLTTAARLALGMLLSLAAGLKAATEIAGPVSGEWTRGSSRLALGWSR